MKSILIPTDFSESADFACNLGLEIAQKLQTRVTFLHLLSTPVDWSKLPLEKENLYPETKAAIGDAKDKLLRLERKAYEKGVEAQTSLMFNIGIEEIHQYISTDKYFLVIMGTHGKKGKNRYTGTNTLKVIHKSPVPVLAVRAGTGVKLPQKWLVVSDFLEDSNADFDLIMNLAKDLKANLHILYINTPYFFTETPEIKYKMEKFTSSHSEVQIEQSIVNAYNEERGIEAFVKEGDFDLVVLITHSRKGLNPVFRRGITEKVLNHLDTPVMSINSNA
ncbi:universal stress protein [Salinimicrobium xinjiangense]|uniref:universal stress protein n=1 Tax=Salinimicrobium xinjiangense TaxID=438596 RepID=UPI0004100409|nr:universal stress protein [Salinimicrobium xinjiangense]